MCRPDGKHWTNERVVVFTEYAHTVDWLQRVLAQHGYIDRLAVIQGSTPPEDREYIRSQFTADPADGTGTGAAGHRCRRGRHRPANLLPPTGQLRHPVQPIPAGTAHRPHRPLRADRRARGLPLRARQPRSTYAADAEFMARIAKKVAQVEDDLGQVNQVIGDRDPAALRRPRPGQAQGQGVDANEVINTALAGGMELNARLTQLEQDFDASRAELHLDPPTCAGSWTPRCGSTISRRLIPVGDDRTDAEVFQLPA